MNKAQLIAKAARKGNITQREVRQGLDAVIEVLVEAFENETNVAIAGLGTFLVKRRGTVRKNLPANGKGPVKGEKRALYAISEKKVVKFNPAPYINVEYLNRDSSCTKIEDINPK